MFYAENIMELLNDPIHHPDMHMNTHVYACADSVTELLEASQERNLFCNPFSSREEDRVGNGLLGQENGYRLFW